MGSRQEDQSLEYLQSWPTGGWCPKGLPSVPRDCLVSQGAGWCPKGLVGWVKNTQQMMEDMPACTLNTSISSSMSSSVSMSSRGSTMTFCTVPRSARHHSAQVLSATQGTHVLPVCEGGLCWGYGKERSPRPSLISLLLWQVAMSGVECACSGNNLCLENATRVPESAQSSMGTCTGQEKDQDESWGLWDAHLEQRKHWMILPPE